MWVVVIFFINKLMNKIKSIFKANLAKDQPQNDAGNRKPGPAQQIAKDPGQEHHDHIQHQPAPDVGANSR